MKKILKRIILNYKNNKCKIYSKEVSFNVKLEENVIIYKDVYIDKNVSIGRYSYISSGSKIYGNTRIGSFCSLGPNVIIGPGEHNYNYFTTHPIIYDKIWNNSIKNRGLKSKETIIGNDVWIGCNAFVKNGVVIGTGAVIGAGAIITKDVPPYAIVVGNPGKIIKYRFKEEIIKKLLLEKWWDKSISEITTYKL